MVDSYTGILYKSFVDISSTAPTLSSTNDKIMFDSSNMAYFAMTINSKWGLIKFDPINQATTPFQPIFYVKPTTTYTTISDYDNANTILFNSDQSRIFVGGSVV